MILALKGRNINPNQKTMSKKKKGYHMTSIPQTISEKLENFLKNCEIKNIDELLKQLPSKKEMSLEHIFIAVYCIISDFTNMAGGEPIIRHSNNKYPQFTDAEVLTIEIVGQLAKKDSQSAWYRYVRKNYLCLFPQLCSRTRYVRRVFQLQKLTEYFQQNLCTMLAANYSKHLLIDSFPIELCNMQRLKNSSQPFESYGANYGYCAAKKLHYYGFKCHIVSDLRGIPIFICLTRASMSDLQAFEFVVEQMFQHSIVKGQTFYIGDKGYVGKEFHEKMEKIYGVTLLSMQREYKSTKYGQSPLNEFLKKVRKLIESTINLFSVELHAGTTKRRTFKGLANSLLIKLASFNLANFFNFLMDEPLLEITNFVY